MSRLVCGSKCLLQYSKLLYPIPQGRLLSLLPLPLGKASVFLGQVAIRWWLPLTKHKLSWLAKKSFWQGSKPRIRCIFFPTAFVLGTSCETLWCLVLAIGTVLLEPFSVMRRQSTSSPHKAVAEVSRIGNLQESWVVVMHERPSELSLSLFLPLSLCLSVSLPLSLSLARSFPLSLYLPTYLPIYLSIHPILSWSILSYPIVFYSILLYPILFYSTLFYSILLYSILFYLFYSILCNQSIYQSINLSIYLSIDLSIDL